MIIDAQNLDFKELNRQIKESTDSEITVINCYGLRYIGTSTSGKTIIIDGGTAGNASGAYLEDTVIRVKGNAQDAIGDTMNSGKIIIEGDAGDALGYGCRGGRIYVKGRVGYRAGIHMKAYKDTRPVIIIGEAAGSFLGEYLAGGYIIVLNLSGKSKLIGNFCATGMHGGKMFFRTDKPLENNNPMVLTRKATEEDLAEIKPFLADYCKELGVDESIIKDEYYVMEPDSVNPYRQLYTFN